MTKQIYRPWGILPLIVMQAFSCFSLQSRSQIEIFSPSSNDPNISENLWYSELHGGSKQTDPNDMLILRFKTPEAVNVLVVPKPTYRGMVPGMLGIQTSPIKLYKADDPHLFIGLMYDNPGLSLGKDCFKIRIDDRSVKSEILSSKMKAQVPISEKIFPKKSAELAGEYASFELRFPVDPYVISKFRILGCDAEINGKTIRFPEIEFSKKWQDRSSP